MTSTRSIPAASLALLAACLLGPPAVSARRASAEILPIRTYTTADGLPHDRVKRIVQDRRGFLWFCTTGGLARFDGRRFLNYGVSEGLPVPSVNDLLETGDGFWVATNGGGLARLDPDASGPSVRVLHVGEGAGSRVNAIVKDRRGLLWVATDGGLYRVAEDVALRRNGGVEGVPLDLDGHPDGSVQVAALLETDPGMLVGTRYGLVLVTGEGLRHVPLGGGEIHAIPALTRGPDGDVLVGLRPGGLVRLDGKTLTEVGRIHTTDGLPNGTVNAILVSKGRWILGTDDGIAVVSGGKVRAYGLGNGLTDRNVGTLAEDREGNVWLGTPGWGGAAMVDLSGSALFGEGDGLGRMVTELLERTPGEIVAFSSDWTVSRLEGDRFRSVRPRLPKHLEAHDWRAFHGMLADRAGHFWFATREGIYRFGPAARVEELAGLVPNAHLTTADGLATDEVSSLFEDSRGDVWIGTFPSVPDPLRVWRRKTGRVERFSAADSLPASGTPYRFVEGREGDVWIAYRDGELVRCRAGRFEVMSGRFGIPPVPVAAMTVDAAGRLWASAWGAGLVRIDRPADPEPTAVVYGTKEGIRDFYLGRLLSLKSGKILIGTAQQLLTFDPSRGAVTESRAARPAFLSEPLAVLEDHAEALWLGSWRGLAKLVPEKDRPAARLRVLVAGAIVSGLPWPVPGRGTGQLDLGELPAESNLAISFLGQGRPGEPVLFEHRMDGIDGRWSSGHAETVVHYGRLAAGSYRFRVRAAGGVEGGSEEAVVSFSVRPPLWRRWWFLCGTALVLAGLGYGLDVARTRRRRALEEVRSRIASDLHDDLGASLSRISILSEVAARTAREGGSPADLIGRIGETSRAVVEKLADGIWAVDPRRDDLRSLGERLRQAAGELLEPAGISWRVEVPEGADRLRLTPDRRREIYLVLKEAIANVARHSGARHATLVVTPGRGRIRFELSDDGRGLGGADARGERLAGGRGLPNMRRRAESLGASLEIGGGPDGGTVVALEVPARGSA